MNKKFFNIDEKFEVIDKLTENDFASKHVALVIEDSNILKPTIPYSLNSLFLVKFSLKTKINSSIKIIK